MGCLCSRGRRLVSAGRGQDNDKLEHMAEVDDLSDCGKGDDNHGDGNAWDDPTHAKSVPSIGRSMQAWYRRGRPRTYSGDF